MLLPELWSFAREEAGVQVNDLEHKEEINSQPVQSKETRILKTALAHVAQWIECQPENQRILKTKDNIRRPWDIS